MKHVLYIYTQTENIYTYKSSEPQSISNWTDQLKWPNGLTQKNQIRKTIQTHSSSHIYLERPTTIESNLVYNKVYPDEKINK